MGLRYSGRGWILVRLRLRFNKWCINETIICGVERSGTPSGAWTGWAIRLLSLSVDADQFIHSEQNCFEVGFVVVFLGHQFGSHSAEIRSKPSTPGCDGPDIV
ncbi:MAG: hypothetical protein KAT65_19045, partial [Methanophagales archaeon]|nr:hypothetical protein [Methanophagales archaeon]